MKLTRIIHETDERLRELERRWRASGDQEDYDNYVRAIARVTPELSEALQNFESAQEVVHNLDIDTEDSNFLSRRLDAIPTEQRNLFDRWIEAGLHLDALLQKYDIKRMCHSYGEQHGPANFGPDPYQQDVNNDMYAYVWQCSDCAHERAMDI